MPMCVEGSPRPEKGAHAVPEFLAVLQLYVAELGALLGQGHLTARDRLRPGRNELYFIFNRWGKTYNVFLCNCRIAKY